MTQMSAPADSGLFRVWVQDGWSALLGGDPRHAERCLRTALDLAPDPNLRGLAELGLLEARDLRVELAARPRGRVLPPKNFDSPRLNRLGRSVLRACLYELGHRARRAPEVPAQDALHARRLHEEGIVVLPDFFPPDVFRTLREEFVRLLGHPEARVLGAGPVRLRELPLPIGRAIEAPAITLHLTHNARIRAIVASVGRRKVLPRPTCCIQRAYACREADEPYDEPYGDGRSDPETQLHSDHFIHVFKAFFYLSETDEHTAFRYAPWTHRLSRGTLLFRYRSDRLRWLAMQGREAEIPSDERRDGRVVPGERVLRLARAHEIAVTAAPNTLVVANTRGFHRRSVLAPESVRETIRLDFREMERRTPLRAWLRRALQSGDVGS